MSEISFILEVNRSKRDYKCETSSIFGSNELLQDCIEIAKLFFSARSGEKMVICSVSKNIFISPD